MPRVMDRAGRTGPGPYIHFARMENRSAFLASGCALTPPHLVASYLIRSDQGRVLSLKTKSRRRPYPLGQ